MQIPHSKPTLDAADTEKVIRCLASGMLENGVASRELENEFCSLYRAQAAVAVGSGSLALLLALNSLEVGEGDEVIIPTYTCPDVMAVVRYIGATPVLVDANQNYLADHREIREAITAHTKAVIFSYQFGIYEDIKPLVSLGIPIIEDCAHLVAPNSAGFEIQGTLAIFSFKATKLLCAGEGGLVLSNNSALAEKLQKIKWSDGSSKLNLFSLSDLNASLAASQLGRIDEFLERRIHIGHQYLEAFGSVSEMQMNEYCFGHSIFYRLPMRLESARRVDDLISYLDSQGISARRPVSPMCHTLFSNTKVFPQADVLYDQTISLPLYPSMRDSEVTKVIEHTISFFG